MKWEFMRLMYAIYLNVLVYYYKFKYTQTRMHEKEIVKKVMDLRKSRSQDDEIQGTITDQTERNTRSDNAAEHEGDHYALFADNDWEEMKKMQAKRPGVSSYMLLNIIKFRGVC
ncbi:hypothetical protein Hanom_Chr04g00362411 [Helianthus anomalus]